MSTDHESAPVPPGTSVESWMAIGAKREGAAWIVPERNAAGEVIGHAIRTDAGAKICKPGSKRGLTMAWPLAPYAGTKPADPIFVVEGASDVVAGVGLALDIVGRPSATGGQELLGALLRGRHVCFIGENDRSGAGRTGALSLATALLPSSASVRVIFPPKGIKDLREWVAAGAGRTELEAAVAATPALTEDPDHAAPAGEVRGTPQSRCNARAKTSLLGAAGGGETSGSASGALPVGVPVNWPDPHPLPDALPRVMPFDPQLLPEALCPWVVDIAERIQCPIDFSAVAAMIALAGMVGRKLGIRPKQHDDWTVVPNLWGGVVGRPGVMKTPAIQEPLKPSKQLEIAAKEEFDDAAKETKADKLVAGAKKQVAEKEIKKSLKNPAEARRIALESLDDEDGDEPIRKRYVINDSTVEKLGEILNENPAGVLVFRDELIGLLRSLDKEGQEGARSFYLEAWNGTGRYTYDRIGRGTIDIEAATLSILGGIQPGPLSEYLAAAAREGRGDDGLIQRFQLLVWPDITKEWVNVDRPPDKEARKRAYAVFNGLAQFDPTLLGADTDPFEPGGIPFLRFDAPAQEMFDRWRATLEPRVRSGELHPALESHLSKYRSLIPSLALLIHLADGHSGPVGVNALQKAIRWGEYLESHARRVYSHVIHPDLAAARALAKKLLAGEVKDGFAVRDIYRRGWSGLAGAEDVQGGVGYLLDLGWLAANAKPTDGRTGTVYLINPKIHDLNGANSGAPPSDATDRTDRSPPTEPSGGSVSASGGGEPGIQADPVAPPLPNEGEEGTWVG